MKKSYYLDGKCIFSYDDDVFSSDEDYTNVMELFIHPICDKVYEKYYQKQLVQQVLEKILRKNDSVFRAYCDIKPLIESENISVDYIQEDENETLLKKLMNEKLNFDEFAEFEVLLAEAGAVAGNEEIKFLSCYTSMKDHFWVKYE